jgi:hypothetical protein
MIVYTEKQGETTRKFFTCCLGPEHISGSPCAAAVTKTLLTDYNGEFY